MSEGDLLADRKRLKRSLGTWRGLAILAVVGALVVLAQQYAGPISGSKGAMPGSSYIAELKVENIISDDPERDELIEQIKDDKNAKALIVWFDSPGGTTVGGEELYLQLKDVAKEKPVIGVMRTLCASACYMASLGADHVIARNSSLTGSIGVLLETAEFSELAKKIGIKANTIKSGKYKDVPSLTEPLDDDGRAVLAETVMDAYDQFVKLVAGRRGLSEDRVRELADGRVYTGRQALPLQLIDGIGGMTEAKDWLVTNKKIDKDLKIELIEPKPEYPSLFAHLSQWTGIEIFNRTSIGLDGLISIWQHSPVQ